MMTVLQITAYRVDVQQSLNEARVQLWRRGMCNELVNEKVNYVQLNGMTTKQYIAAAFVPNARLPFAKSVLNVDSQFLS